MKYIRTKEGIYEVNSQPKPEKELQFKSINDFDVVCNLKTMGKLGL